MRKAEETLAAEGEKHAAREGTRGEARRMRKRLSLAALVACVALPFVDSYVISRALPLRFKTDAANEETTGAVESQGGARSFSKFTHASEAHRGVACASCHRRADNSAQPRTPGHKACTDCHLQQFVAEPDLPLCAVCHTNLESGNPPVKPFPRLQGFNVKFDHAQHTSGGGRSERGCADCHQSARGGAALTIPAGLGAHSLCYTCHTPQAASGGRDIASCGACHDLAPYGRTGTGAKAFRVGFKHSTHGERQGVTCNSCHTVRANLPQSRQVSSPQAAQHFAAARAQSCASCHDNRRAFGGDDFSDCKKCHKGSTFRF